MILYDPIYKVWHRPYFDGCYGNRTDPGLCAWVVPGTWPDWTL